MEHKKRFLLAVIVLPWLTVPFLGKKAFKRFSLTALFICGMFGVQSVIAHKRGWWRVYPKLFPNMIGEFPFMIGPFFVGALWILKFTFGRFLRYTLLNLAVDYFHIYFFVAWLKRMGVASLIRLKNYQAYSLFTINAVLMYGFQMVVEKWRARKHPKTFIEKLFS
ncbi:MAG: hypothetical protein AB2392_06635 [Neobacillus sp.]